MNKRLLIMFLWAGVALLGLWLYIGASPSDGMATHQSEEYGYLVRYPSDWRLDVSHELTSADGFEAPSNDAEVYIQVLQDNRVREGGGRAAVLSEVKQELERTPGHTVSAFDESDNGYKAEGVFDNREEVWLFLERAKFTEDGFLYIIRANVLESAWDKHQRTIDAIIGSFKIGGTSSEARALFGSAAYSIFFWIGFWILIPLLLSKYFFTYNKKKIDNLRYVTIALDVFALGLVFSRWMPMSYGGETGLSLFLKGRWEVAVFVGLVMLTVLFLFAGRFRLLVAAVVLQFFSSAFFFFVMLRILPESYYITKAHVAPIILIFALLIANIFVALLYHQLEIKQYGFKRVIKNNFINRYWSEYGARRKK